MRERIINLFWLLVEQGGRILSSLLITILIVNYLGAERFGSFSLALAILTALGPIVGLGMDAILFKRFISQESSALKLIETSCLLRLIIAIIIIISTTLLNLLLSDAFWSILNVLVFGFLFDSFLSFKDYFLAKLKNKFYTYSTLVSFLLQLGLVYILVTKEANVSYLALTYVFAKGIQSCSLYFSYAYLEKVRIVPKWNINLSKSLLSASFPMMLASTAGLLYSLQDQFFIKAMLDETELGIYVVGIKLVMICIVLPTIVSNVFYPSLVSKFEQANKAPYEQQLEAIYAVFFIAGVLFFLFLFLSADSLIDLLFNDEFSRSSDIMKIYALILICAFFQSINNKVLVLHNLQSVIFKRVLLALILNAVLNFILIPQYGLVGAAYSTVLSELFIVVSYVFRADTRFIFRYQLKALFLVNLFNPRLIQSIKA